MEPFYFLDLDIEYPLNKEEECDLSEYMCMYPDGSWSIGDLNNNEYKIIYNKEKYVMVEFDNDNKIIYFYKSEKIIKKFKIKIEEFNN